MRGRTEWTKMMNTRQWCQHSTSRKGMRGLATKAPEDEETEFVDDSLSDRKPVKLLPNVVGDRIELSPLKYQPCGGSQHRLKLAEQLGRLCQTADCFNNRACCLREHAPVECRP